MARCEGRLSKQKEHSPAISSTAAQKERKKKKKTHTHAHTELLVLSCLLSFFFFLCGSLSSGKRIVIIIIICINCFAWPYFQLPIFVCVFKKKCAFWISISLSLSVLFFFFTLRCWRCGTAAGFSFSFSIVASSFCFYSLLLPLCVWIFLSVFFFFLCVCVCVRFCWWLLRFSGRSFVFIYLFRPSLQQIAATNMYAISKKKKKNAHTNMPGACYLLFLFMSHVWVIGNELAGTSTSLVHACIFDVLRFFFFPVSQVYSPVFFFFTSTA